MGFFGSLFSNGSDMVRCERCGRLIPKDQGIEYKGEFLCQDCASKERDLDDMLFDDLMDDDE